MRNVILRKIILGAAVAAAAIGCDGVTDELTGFVERFFVMSVLPPPGGAAGYVGAQGGQVVVMLEIQNGSNIRTKIDFSTSPPGDVTARVVPQTIDHDIELEPDQTGTARMLVNIGANRAPGPMTVSVTAKGTATRTDISGSDFTQEETVTVEITVVADGEPPVVVITRPQAGERFSGVPIPASADVTDAGGLLEVRFQLNAEQIESLFELGTGDDPQASVNEDFDLARPRSGANTLVVAARDALGQLTTTAVDFLYEPTGQCQYFTVVPALSRAVAAPGERVSIPVTITPRGGWSGELGVHPGRGLLVSATNETFTGVSGPIEAVGLVNLRSDLVPGTVYGLIIEVEGRTQPQSRCEVSVPLDIVQPGVGAAPQITLDGPQSGSVTASPTWTLTGTVTDDGEITRVYYNNQDDSRPAIDILRVNAPSPFAFAEAVALVSGLNLITVHAIDDQGRASANSISVTYDPNASGQCTEFTLDVSPETLEATRGVNDYAGVIITRIGGFAGAVTLRIEEPFAAQFFSNITFNPNPTAGNSTMAFTVTNGSNSSQYIGQTYTFTVVGASSASSCSTTFTVFVLDV